MKILIHRTIPTFLAVISLLLTGVSVSASQSGERSSIQEALLVEIDHEAGNLSEYTAVMSDGGDLSVDPSAALAGTGYGMRVLLDDTNNIYAYRSLPAASTNGVLRVMISVDPNSLSMANLDEISFAYFVASDMVTTVGSMQFFYQNGYNFRGAVLDDSGVHHHTQPFPISDGPHRIEIRITRAASSTSKDGAYETWIDGAAKTALRGIDNYDRFSNFKTVSLGANSSVGRIRGSYYLDELAVSNNGTSPGPITGTNPCATPATSQGCKSFLPLLIR